jgi:hypothetical protein
MSPLRAQKVNAIYLRSRKPHNSDRYALFIRGPHLQISLPSLLLVRLRVSFEELILAVITSPAFEFDYSKLCKENALFYASILFRLIMEDSDGNSSLYFRACNKNDLIW